MVVVAVTAVLTGLSLYYIRQVPIRGSYMDLLPRNDPLIEKYRTREEELSATDYAAVLLTLASPPADREAGKALLREAADRLISVLLEDPEIVRASYRIGEDISYPPELLLFQKLTPQDLAALKETAGQAISILKGLPLEELGAVPAGGLAPPAQAAPPEEILAGVDRLLSLGEEVLAVLPALPRLEPLIHEAAGIIKGVLAAPVAQSHQGTELFSRDGTKLVIQVWPRDSSYAGLSYCQKIDHILRQGIAAAGLNSLGVEAELTGAYTAVAEGNEVIKRDTNLTTWISSGGVLVILALTFASFFLTIVSLIPLLVSAVLMVAWAKLAVGGFNLITTFLPALVLGLGIDFSIHLIARYVEERQAGSSVTKALETATRRKGEASLGAALTTAGVFLALLISRSRGLEEMGAIMSVGIVIAYLAAMLLTPSLMFLSYAVVKRRFRERTLFRPDSFTRFYRNLIRQRRAVVALTIGLSLALVYQASQVRFKFASAELAPHTRAMDVAQEILEELQGKVSFADQFVFFVPDPAQLRPLEEKLLSNPLVTGVDSLRHLLPQELIKGKASFQDVQVDELMGALRSLKELLSSWDDRERDLERLAPLLSELEIATALNGQVELASKSTHLLRRLVSLRRAMAATDSRRYLELVSSLEGDMAVIQGFIHRLRALPGEAGLLEKLVGILPEQVKGIYYSERSHAFVVRALLSPELYEGNNLKEFIAWVKGLGVDYFGIPEAQARLETYMKRDFAVSTGIAAVLIGLLVWTSLASLRDTILALSPLAIGYLWMLAGMRLMGIAFNFTNIVISPLLIGIGVDSAIHILYRIEEEKASGRRFPCVTGAATTLIPIFSTSATTMLVFGALLLARTPGLRFLGISALLGLGFTLLASLLFLPCAAAWLDRGSRND